MNVVICWGFLWGSLRFTWRRLYQDVTSRQYTAHSNGACLLVAINIHVGKRGGAHVRQCCFVCVLPCPQIVSLVVLRFTFFRNSSVIFVLPGITIFEPKTCRSTYEGLAVMKERVAEKLAAMGREGGANHMEALWERGNLCRFAKIRSPSLFPPSLPYALFRGMVQFRERALEVRHASGCV